MGWQELMEQAEDNQAWRGQITRLGNTNLYTPQFRPQSTAGDTDCLGLRGLPCTSCICCDTLPDTHSHLVP